MVEKWVILWHFAEGKEDDINLNSVHDTENDAREYLDKIRVTYGKTVNFTVLGIPVNS